MTGCKQCHSDAGWCQANKWVTKGSVTTFGWAKGGVGAAVFSSGVETAIAMWKFKQLPRLSITWKETGPTQRRSSQKSSKRNLFRKMQGAHPASGGSSILWDNLTFHDFQANYTKACKTASTEACNSSMLPAYHLNESVSGETKDKEKLPVVPDSPCWRGCWEKKTHHTTTKRIYFRGGRWEDGWGRHLLKNTSGQNHQDFISCESESAALCQPGSRAQRCRRWLLCTGFPQHERTENRPAPFEIQQNLLLPTVQSGIFSLNIRFFKRAIIFPLLLSEMQHKVTETKKHAIRFRNTKQTNKLSKTWRVGKRNPYIRDKGRGTEFLRNTILLNLSEGVFSSSSEPAFWGCYLNKNQNTNNKIVFINKKNGITFFPIQLCSQSFFLHSWDMTRG